MLDRDGSDQECTVVDVVMHPWVIEQCQRSSVVKTQVVRLALEWVKQETTLQLATEWKFIKATYKGGADNNQSGTPVPFPIQQANEQASPIEQRSASGQREALSSPSALLATVKAVAAKETEAAELAEHVNITKKDVEHASKQSSPPLIQEVGSSGSPVMTAPAPKEPTKGLTPKRKSKPAVQRGFLNNTSSRLYGDEGSGNGSSAGTLARLMDKCKVVDLQNMPPQQLPSKPADTVDDIAAASHPVEKQKRDHELEALMAKVDDEFNLASRWDKQKEGENTAEFEQFAKLAQFLSGIPTAAVPPPPPPPLPGRATEQEQSGAAQPTRVHVDNPLALAVRAEIVQGTSVLEVHIDHVDFAVAAAELLTSENQIVVDIKGRGKLTVTSPARIAVDATKASFSRKLRRFKITAPLAER